MSSVEEKKNNPWPNRLKALQLRLGLSNHEMADRLGIAYRVWVSWKYGERQPQTGSITLINMLIAEADRLGL